MTAAVVALSAAMLEELDELREQVEAMPKPAEPPAINYALLADFVMTRIEPRLQLLEDRAIRIEASLALLKIRARRMR